MPHAKRVALLVAASVAGILGCAVVAIRAQGVPPVPQPPAGAAPSLPAGMAANAKAVYILRGNTLYAFSAEDLREIGRVTLDNRMLATAGSGRGPWESDLVLYTGADGDTFHKEGIFVGASGVPSLARDSKGRLLAAFQWFPAEDPAHFDRVAVKVSEDGGRSWRGPLPIEVAGLPGGYQRPFDPTLAPLPDGRIRLYFSSGPVDGGPHSTNVATYSAISSDGVRYAFEPGARFSVPGRRVIDCAVLHFQKKWHYYAPIGRPEEGAYHAVSDDGLGFTRMPDIPSVGGANWTGNVVAYGDGMRFYGSSRRGVWWAFSRDGATWTAPTYLGVFGGDPAAAQAPDGRVLLITVGEPRGAENRARP